MIKIIKAEERHIPDVCKLWWEFMKYSEEIDPVFAPEEGVIPVFEKQELRPTMQNKDSLILVALDGKKTVGYSYSLIIRKSPLGKRQKSGLVHDLFVTEDCRRKGTGEKLYAEILKWFHSQGVDRVELQVIAKNKAGCSFWRKHGYGDFQHTWCREI